MKTIRNNSLYQVEVQKSKFITLLYKVKNKEEIINYLKQVKDTYKGATHYCYAYKLENESRFSDDSEPSGTAGLPMMEVLTKQNLNFILVIIVRYFGGIKLGASGLIRTYANSLIKALSENTLVELTAGYRIELNCEYHNQKQLDYVLSENNFIIEAKKFNEKVTYHIILTKPQLQLLTKYKVQILEEVWVET